MIYENGNLKMVLVDGGYYDPSSDKYYFYLTDHLGNNRVVADASGNVIQATHYYPYGMSFAESANPAKQPFKYNAKELDMENGLNLYDYVTRGMDPALGRFMTVDPMAEKYYSVSLYAYCMNNPIKYIDIKGDSLTLSGSNMYEIFQAIYNGLEEGTNISIKFNNGVLDPTSIEEQAKNSSDFFLKDIYEIAINPTVVELSVSNKNTYILNNQQIIENFNTPIDVNTSEFGAQYEGLLKSWGEPTGKSINGNLGQTLIPGNISVSGKSSTNKNIQVIVNGKGTLNHRSVGIAHEFGHVILYLRGLPYGHTQPGVDEFVYKRSTIMLKRLGYDY